MYVRVSLVLAVALGACTRTHDDDAKTAERDVAEQPRSFVLEERWCVPEASTVELPADRQAPVSKSVGACGNFVDDAAIGANPIPCGPCGFVLDPDVTSRARERVADACCYEVSSPPPPPLQPSLLAGDPRFACSKNGDCVASCQHGAVARAWYEATYPGGEACQDGCTSKGTEPPMCVDGGCVARRAGLDDPSCTRLSHPPLVGPGPAHACQRDAECTNDCALGAINAEWLTTQGDRPTCKDGCTSKGTEPARCEDGTCVGYRLGARDPTCSRRPVW